MRRLRLIVSAVLCTPTILAGQAKTSNASTASLSALEARGAHYADVAKQIWGFAELGYQEYKSSALLRRELVDLRQIIDLGRGGGGFRLWW